MRVLVAPALLVGLCGGCEKAPAPAAPASLARSAGPVAQPSPLRSPASDDVLLSFDVTEVAPCGLELYVAQSAKVAAARCAAAGIEGVTATAGSASAFRFDVRIPKTSADQADLVRRLVSRPGRIEFRIRADPAIESAARASPLSAESEAPQGFTWVLSQSGDAPVLVETPERPLAAKIRDTATRPSGDVVADAAKKSAQADYDKTVAVQVFTNEQIAAASVERTMSSNGAQRFLRTAVRFEFKDERKAAFERFTGDHVGRVLVVVVDGKAHVSPVIKSALPGAGELVAPGVGYTDEEAREMAALLACGPLPCRLVPVDE